MSTAAPGLDDLVASGHRDAETMDAHRTSFEAGPARFVHLRGFLRDEVAAQLSRFLLEQAVFYTEYGTTRSDDPVSELEWAASSEGERFFRMGKLLKTRDGFELSPEALRYLRFRREVQDDAMRGFFEAISGLSLRSTDDFGVHAMGDGDFLSPHSDAKLERQLAIVLYLTPGWCHADGGVLEIRDREGEVHEVAPEYNSVVAFDVRAGTEHQVTPVTTPSGHPPRVTIGGWYDARPPSRP